MKVYDYEDFKEYGFRNQGKLQEKHGKLLESGWELDTMETDDILYGKNVLYIKVARYTKDEEITALFMEEAMTENEILNKIYEDRKQKSDDMMYFYTKVECQEMFGMSIDDIEELLPIEFVNVVTWLEGELATWGDFEKVYEEYFEVDWKEIALNLISLAETLDYFGDYEDLRDRLRKECELTESKLDIIGV